MKKGLLWGLIAVLLIVPFITVKAAANVEITKIELIEASEGVVVNEEPTASGLNINFDLAFGNVNDQVKYSVTIKNNDAEDYSISNTEPSISSYMKYEFVFEDGSEVIEANSEKILNIVITYETEVDEAEIDPVTRKYTEAKQVEVKLVNGNNEEVVPAAADIENPKTGDNVLLYVNLLLVSVILCGVAIKTKKVRKGVALLALALVALPLSVKALEEITITLNTEIEISKDREFCYVYDYGYIEQEATSHHYEAGKTWEEYINEESQSLFEIVENDVELTDTGNEGIKSSNTLTSKLKANSEKIYFVPAEFSKCMNDVNSEIDSIINGRNFEDLTEEEQTRISEITNSEEYNANVNKCYEVVENLVNVKKTDAVKSADKGCYVRLYPMLTSTEE